MDMPLFPGTTDDTNGDGLIDGSKFYRLVTDQGSVALKTWRGSSFEVVSSRSWTPLKSVSLGSGYRILLEGQGRRTGSYQVLDVNEAGRINRKSDWISLDQSLADGWEDEFGDLIQVDGEIGPASDGDSDGFLDGHRRYQIYLDGISVPLSNKKGVFQSKKTAKGWEALKAVSVEDGFEVLVGSVGRAKPRFRVLDVDLDGVIQGRSRWFSGPKALFAGWNTQFRTLLLGKGSRGGVEAASTGGGSPVGELIYTATADDSSTVTYALKDEGQGFDGVLTVDQDSGEVRLVVEKLKDIPKDISFKLIITDIAGNSSEWPVTVKLNPREKIENDEKGVVAGTEGGISAMSVDPSDLNGQATLSTDLSEESNSNDNDSSDKTDDRPTNGGGEEILVSMDETSDIKADNELNINEETPNAIVSEPDVSDPDKSNDEDSTNNPNPNEESTNAVVSEPDSSDPDKSNDEEPTNNSSLEIAPEEEPSDQQQLSTPVLLNDSDSGISQTDGVTYINTPTLIGTSAANATVELKTDEGLLLGITTADSEGNWSFTIQSGEALNDGSHSITALVIAEDGAALQSSAALKLTVDTQAPELTSNSSAEAEILVAQGTLDQNNDGLVDGTNQSQILHEGAGLLIANADGGNKGNSDNKNWGYQILKAIATETGYDLLIKGTGRQLSGKFSIWSTDKNGLISQKEQWKSAEDALVYGWEEKFGDMIKADGVITPAKRNTFFVSLDGDDSNPGTLEAPFKTIKMGVRHLGQTRNIPGGSLTIRGGTYRLPIGEKWAQPDNKENSTISISGYHGQKDQPIRIQSYQDEEVIITGAHPVTSRWVKHDDNIWKTQINYLPSQLFLDGKMLTGARWPNINKDWDQPDNSNANNPTPGSYWHPNSFASSSTELPTVALDGAVVVPHTPDGGNSIQVIEKKEEGSSSITLSTGNNIPADLRHQNMPGHYYLTNHLNLLDRPGEWHLQQKHDLINVKMSYGMDVILKRKPSILYAWMPDGSDPNTRNIEARAFSHSPNLAAENNLLKVEGSSNLVFDGINFEVGEIDLNGVNDTTISNSKLLYSGHHSHMLVDAWTGEHFRYGHGGYVNNQTNNMAYGGDKGLARGYGIEKDRNLTIRDSEVAYTYGGNFLTWGKGVSGNTVDNVYFHNKPAGFSAFEIGRDSANNKVRRVEYHTFGYGGVGRIGNQIWRTQEYGGDNYPTSVIELSRVYNPFFHGDDAGFQINQAQVYNLVVRQNWTHDLPGRNGIRFDGSPSGFGGTAHHNVSFNNRRGFRLKGDYHTILNNLAFNNARQDVRVTPDKFYGWRPGTNCAPTQKMKQNGEWFCKQIGAPIAGHANSIIHNNAGDKDTGIPVKNPANSTGNSMGTKLRNGRFIIDELRDINNFDFRPREGSSLIDRGTHKPGFTDGFNGSAPDIGAYEYGDDNYWIPGYQANKARTPIPNNGAYNAKIDTDLIWLEGRHGESSNVYFGSNPSDLKFQGNQINNIFTPKEQLIAGQTYYWRIDTVTEKGTIPGDVWMFAPVNPEAPEPPDAPLLDQESDTGASNSDRSTSTNTPTFSGEGTAGETVELFQNSVSLGTSEIGLDGQWTYTIPAELVMQDGIHTITAKTSMTGVSSAMSKPLLVSIDSTAPAFTSSETAPAIEENSGAEQFVHTVTASDLTAIKYRLSLENTDDSEHFAINETTGDLRLLINPNFEAKETYTVVVEALDLAGNRKTQSVTVPIKDVAESDLNLDGLLDGSGQTQIFINGKVVTIYDDNGQPQGDYANAKIGYNFIKAVVDEDQYRILLQGIGRLRAGKFKQWSIDEAGQISSQSEWKTRDQALALGWEEDFGDIIDKDGFVGVPPATDANGDGLVDGTNQSKIFQNERGIPITNNRGTVLKGNFKNGKLGYVIIKAAKTNAGFDILLKGNGIRNRGRFMEWSTNSDGIITTRSSWISADSAVTQGWEDRFGDIIKIDGQVGVPPAEDKNGDGLVDGLKQPLIFDGGSGLAIKNQRGKAQGNSNSKKTGYKVIKAVSTDDGFALLLKGTGTKRRNQFLQWKTNPKGIIQSGSGWQSAKAASDWEEQFGDIIKPDGVIGRPAVAEGPAVVEGPLTLDQNNDGLVDGTNQSQIFDDNTGLPITNSRGRVMSNWRNRKFGYNILKAVPKDEGFEVLLKGAGKKNRGRFLIWSTDESGMITGNTGWKKTPFALKNDWESIFGDIIQPNGVID